MIENPLTSLSHCIAFDSRDWSLSRRDAWIYAIVIGWDNDSLNELADKFHWDDYHVERLKRLHDRYKQLEDLADEGL